VSVPEPGYDEIIVTAPAGGQLCNSRACASAERLAEVVVTYGVLADPGAGAGDRPALWPESWGRSVPMCTGCWEQTRPFVIERRPGLVIRDFVGAPAATPSATEGAAMPDPAAGRQGAVVVDGERWREAAQLRHDHAGWAIVWLAPAGEFRAYRRLPGARRDTALAAATAGDLSAQIGRAEQSARPAATPRDQK
jgi:hypothetical protein